MRKLSELDAAEWALYSRLLDEALARSEPERTRWLQSLPPEHAGLRPLLDAALKAEAEVRAAPECPRPRIAGQDDPYLFAAGRRVGPYRLLEPLGRGGMGEVWRAQRDDETLKREVALKLPHTWLLTAAMRLRLSRERDILAGLAHPNIAQLYDAGIDADGQPWLALERVHGRRIDEHCRQFELSVEQRLVLFEQVLDAVQSAHARLTVHRDLKPTNILVTDDGTVKLLDFGIAKLINEQGTGHSTELTQLTGRAATPDYAAPEQLAGDTITVGTDVYALGVVLYELLCGQRPFGKPHGAEREFLPLASTRVRAEHAVQCNGSSARALRRALTGDLDAILAKALAPKPGERYGSVERLAEDLRRHRRLDPIEARHITRAERAYRFVRRNTLPMAAATVLTVALVTSSVFLWQAVQARREADRQAAMQQAVSEFLTQLLTANDPFADDSGNPDITVREVVDRAARKTDSFKNQPAQEAAVRLVLGTIYTNAGDHEAAQKQIRLALERAESLGAAGQGLVNQARLALVEDLSYESDYAATRAELNRLFAQPGLTPRQRLHADQFEAMVPDDTGVDWSLSLQKLQALRPRFERLYAPERPEYIYYLNDLAQRLIAVGPLHRALDVLHTIHELGNRDRPDHPSNIKLRALLGDTLVRSGDGAQGLPLLEEAQQSLKKRLTADIHPLPAVTGWLGNAYRLAGRHAEALRLLTDSRSRLRRTQGDNFSETRLTGADLAELYLDMGQPRKALEILEPIYELLAQKKTARLAGRWKMALRLGRVRAAAGRLPDALRLLQETHAAARAAFGADHWLTGCLAGELAHTLGLNGQTADAAALMPEALAAVRKHLRPNDPMRRRVESFNLPV